MPRIGCSLLLCNWLIMGTLANCIITVCLNSLILSGYNYTETNPWPPGTDPVLQILPPWKHLTGTGHAHGKAKVSDRNWSWVFQQVTCHWLERESFHGNMLLFWKASSEGCVSGQNREGRAFLFSQRTAEESTELGLGNLGSVQAPALQVQGRFPRTIFPLLHGNLIAFLPLPLFSEKL